MRANQNVKITATSVQLVPYRKEHVARYHEWMQDPVLREATASEPLNLEEEYEMQRSWAEDEDKCTFILLDRSLPEGEGMCGDANLYLNDPEDRHCAEIEIMIAEPASRGKGIAREALTLMMAWAVQHLGIRKFVAKIGEANEASQGLFRSLHYVEVGRSLVFREITYEHSLEQER